MSRFVIKQFGLATGTQSYHRVLSPFSSSALKDASSSLSSSSTSDPSSPPDTVHISENCIRKMKELQCGEGEKKLLRLSVNSGGCSGFKYVFDLDCTTTSDDRVFEKDGIKLIVDSFSYKFVRGSMVDYEDTLIKSAFVVAENPSADKKCGCQNSFTVKE